MSRILRILFGLFLITSASYADTMCRTDWELDSIQGKAQLIQNVKTDPKSNVNTYRYPADAQETITGNYYNCKKGQSYKECSPVIYDFFADMEAQDNYCDKPQQNSSSGTATCNVSCTKNMGMISSRYTDACKQEYKTLQDFAEAIDRSCNSSGKNKKDEKPASPSKPDAQTQCKNAGNLWEDGKCKTTGDSCTKFYGSGVGTYVKVGNEWKCKLTACNGAGYGIDKSDNGYSCTIIGSKKEAGKPENPEQAELKSKLESDIQKIMDAFNKKKTELEKKQAK